MISRSSYVNLCIILTAFKFLFLPLYFSTDFDVHRNWLAITFNLPLDSWYFDETSKWTLDYPPLFAWFEYALATMANIVDPGMLKLTSGTIHTYNAVVFQRTSVIFSDILYYYAIYELCHAVERSNFLRVDTRSVPAGESISSEEDRDEFFMGHDDDASENLSKIKYQSLLEAYFNPSFSTSCNILMMLHPSLLIVDHIHFQYNGFLSAFLILSVSRLVTKRYIDGAIWFALLLNLKHIYLYCAPAFGIYLLRKYCIGSQDRFTGWGFTLRLHQMGTYVGTIFLATFMPFMQAKSSIMPHNSPVPRGLMQIANRLFPFKRGLCHAYWAPNFWAIYNSLDKFISMIFGKRSQAVMTGGLIQDYSHQYLPTIRPMSSFMAVAAMDIPIVIKLWKQSKHRIGSSQLFLRALALCAFTSFQFGYHVHEKAIILVLLPLIPLAFVNQKLARSFMFVSVAGTYGLFPLLYETGEWPIKVLLHVIYHIYALRLLNLQFSTASSLDRETSQQRIAEKAFSLYAAGCVFLELYCTFLHGYSYNPLRALNRLEFLPLLLTSLYSSLGVMYGYVLLYSEMTNSQIVGP